MCSVSGRMCSVLGPMCSVLGWMCSRCFLVGWSWIGMFGSHSRVAAEHELGAGTRGEGREMTGAWGWVGIGCPEDPSPAAEDDAGLSPRRDLCVTRGWLLGRPLTPTLSPRRGSKRGRSFKEAGVLQRSPRRGKRARLQAERSCTKVSREGIDTRAAGSEGRRQPQWRKVPGGINGRPRGAGNGDMSKVQTPFAQGEKGGHRWLVRLSYSL